jgi:hypothetical protein
VAAELGGAQGRESSCCGVLSDSIVTGTPTAIQDQSAWEVPLTLPRKGIGLGSKESGDVSRARSLTARMSDLLVQLNLCLGRPVLGRSLALAAAVPEQSLARAPRMKTHYAGRERGGSLGFVSSLST